MTNIDMVNKIQPAKKIFFFLLFPSNPASMSRIEEKEQNQ